MKIYSQVKQVIQAKFLLEAFVFDLRNVYADSYEKITWKCEYNHVWVDKIINRTIHDHKCPKCELNDVK